MNTEKFSAWLGEQQPSLEAWGSFIVSEVCARVKLEIGDERYKAFFKVPPSCRVKEISSAEKKQKKKHYANPNVDMTDLVGARFVVLLRSDISIVENVIRTHGSWTTRRDRDPINERDERPSSFDYQSVHYILRNPEDKLVNTTQVPAEIACEVQIRTILQHAYAELGHDRIYKEEAPIPPSVHRLVARSMALMETTDEMFCAAVEELARVNLGREAWAKVVDECFLAASIEHTPTLEDEEAITIIDTFAELLGHADSDDVRGMATGAMIKNLKARAKEDNLFGKPVVLLVYWLAKNNDSETTTLWPMPKFSRDVEQVFSDLGIS